MGNLPMPPTWVLDALWSGLVIPAHPLALTQRRRLDAVRQCALTRYYHAAGAGGVAVGVHTTQFEVRQHKLLPAVLGLAAKTAAECDMAAGRKTVLIAGICGKTRQALREACLAREIGYHAGLLSLAAWRDEPELSLIRHCREVARVTPLFGFYLQPAVGGRVLSRDFWRRFAEIENVVGIKVAAFNRYQTLDVVRAVAEVGRADSIALYTGNDDNIVVDLLTNYEIAVEGRKVRLGMRGGLLGHWACWTRRAVELLELCKRERSKPAVSSRMLTLASAVTDCNAAFFDPAHQFAGCIASIHEVLRRQGLLANRACLDPGQKLSPGQRHEIDRVCNRYPELNDDAFVRKHVAQWIKGVPGQSGKY
jgi:dihydrodipicolinate synthase/N-acetylneuraminate lyase